MKLEARAVLDWKEGLLGGGWAIEVSGSGITGVERCSGAASSNLVVSPGLVQGHVHLCQTLFRGMAEGLPLLPWLETRIWPLEAAHTPDSLAASVVLSLRELLLSGCTGLLDMGSVRHSSVTVDLLRRSGMRALTGNSLMDLGPGWIASDIAWLREEARRVRDACGGLTGFLYAPRFALSCSESVWEWMASDAAGRPRSTHAAETAAEMEAAGMVRGNVRFLEERGFLGQGAVLAHCVHLLPGEGGLLASSGTSVVHCPWTNLRLGSGIADIPALDAAGVSVLLGSDGAACNNGLDPASDARLAMALSAVTGGPGRVASSRWFRSLTQGAAEALGWKDVGRVAPGFQADLAVLEPTSLEWDQLDMAADPLRFVLELPWPERVRVVMVAGVELLRDGEFPTLPALPASVPEERTGLEKRARRLRSGD